ncbi:MAG TPA: hypothetical protein DCE11_03235 [Ruminiclostridium sp.]|jgi:hypothetical protein|nr:hypothetical protein [Clostridiaceae bacterium]HAA25122.1 hypothetical protein [Ruminiclostridium sp.]
MSQGMDDRMRQISDMLNSREAQDGIRRLIGSFNSSSDAVPVQSDQHAAERAFFDSQKDNPIQSQESDWINKIQNLLSQASNIQDSRINLLRSVHPFLNQARKERCETCINILRVADIIKAVTNKNGRLL